VWREGGWGGGWGEGGGGGGGGVIFLHVLNRMLQCYICVPVMLELSKNVICILKVLQNNVAFKKMIHS
jgi:hypothetical protein